MKIHNHLYPVFHIKKWTNNGGKIFDKTINCCRKVDLQNDFSKEFYYSLGSINSELEDKISEFECYIAKVIKKIDEADNKIVLSSKDLEILKLYCVLCASRHENTCEVIKEDELSVYKSNNYFVGVHKVEDQEAAVCITEDIIADFKKIKDLDDDIETLIDPCVILPQYIYSPFTLGLHISIVRADEPNIFISDRFSIIENTIDSDFLYVYVPISPKTALFLVKSKYYFDCETFLNTKNRLGKKYGSGIPDPFLSVILGGCQFDYEDCLFCSYSWIKSRVHLNETFIKCKKSDKVTIEIKKLPNEIFRKYNSIFCEDGEKILFCNQDELKYALNNKLEERIISMV